MVDLTLRGQYEQAKRLALAGDLDQGLAVCRRILEAFPKHIGTYEVLGRIYLDKGEHEEAANFFRRVLSADPESTLSYASLGIIYEERDLLDEAIWQMERAYELSPGNQEIRRQLLRLYGKRDMDGSPTVRLTRGALARSYLRGQLYAKAIGELCDLVSEEPDRFDLRLALGESMWLDGRREEAGAVYQGIVAQLPNCLKANIILGSLWLNTERDEDARELLGRAQTLDPDNSAAQNILGPDSPLPPRISRLPARDSDVPPPDLPYLDDQSDGLVIEGRGHESQVPPASALADDWMSKSAGPAASDAREGELVPGSEAPGGMGHEQPSATTAAGPRLGNGWPADQSIRILKARLDGKPENDRLRVTLARQLRDEQRHKEAIAQYRYLTSRGPRMLSMVIRDLEHLVRQGDADQAVAELLSQAYEVRDRMLAGRTE